MLMRVWRWFLREVANFCIVPGLRNALFRLSGVAIGTNAQVSMKLTIIDDYKGGMVSIGKRCAIGSTVTIITVSYPNNSRLKHIPSLHQAGRVIIGDDTWVAPHCAILPGITIGSCAIIAAGSVVTKDVPDFAIMAGVPARQIGDVRDKEGSEVLLNSETE